MYELIQAAKNTYYIQSPSKIGLYVDDEGAATLIDSGLDKEAGRKISQHLRANNWALKTILSTHAHADHVGGNAFLRKRTDCAVLAGEIEHCFASYPQLEPSLLYGGFPPRPLRNKFLMAEACAPTGDFSALPDGFEVIPLPGHYFNMAAVRTPDNVLFLADALSGAAIVEKYHVNFIYDVGAYLQTLDMVENLAAKLFIPAHAEPVADIRPLVKINRDKVHEIIALLLSLCEAPRAIEELLKAVFDHYGLMMDFNQYVLVGSTVRSYMAYLLDEGKARADFIENRLVWATV